MRNPDCHMKEERLTPSVLSPSGPGLPALHPGTMGGLSSPALAALLCLGLCLGPWDQVQAGTLHRPSIWAEPGTTVPKGSRVTLWCEGSPQAGGLCLYRGNVSVDWESERLQRASNQTGFVLDPVDSPSAGLYRCAHLSSNSSSEPLALVVTGVFDRPSLSAQPGPVVEAGGSVTLFCSSESSSGSFHLLKEGAAGSPSHMELPLSRGEKHVLFPVGPVNSSHAGTYRCYGSSSSFPQQWSEPSEPLHLQVTGMFEAPSLVAQPGPLVLAGDSVTLHCQSQAGFDSFALTRDEGLWSPQCLAGQCSPDFPLGSVNSSHGGRYRCLGGYNMTHLWSAPSAPLDLLVVGGHRKPSLLALPGPRVPWNKTVTLQCRSDTPADTFRLAKEGSPAPPLLLHRQDPTAPFEANFTFSALTSEQEGTYRCYSSLNSTPHLLSLPSEPLKIQASEDGWYLNLLIGVAVALVLLLSLLLLLLLRRRCRREHRKAGAAETPAQSERAQLDPQHSVNYEDPEGVTYAEVNHARTRRAAAGDTSRRQSQVKQDAPETAQDVTYAQLTHLTRRGEPAAPTSTPVPSVYATLVTH